MTKMRICILYEQGQDRRPHSSSYIRLLRPFSHPLISEEFEVSFGRYLGDSSYDVVILDRLWRSYDIDFITARNLVAKIKRQGIKLLYAFDDHLEVWVDEVPGIPRKYLDVFRLFLESADGVIVTTQRLKEAFQDRCRHIEVIPNMLDERLLARRRPNVVKTGRPLVIGYMGTNTHTKDFEAIAPALIEISSQFREVILFEFIGVWNKEIEKIILSHNLPHRVIYPHPHQIEYPLFMLWFTSTIRWDIGLAPISDLELNKYKSDIKFLDYSAICAVGIYSFSEPYVSVKNLSNGLLVRNNPNEWYRALRMLIEDGEVRELLKRNAFEHLYAKRVIGKQSCLFISKIKTLVEGNIS